MNTRTLRRHALLAASLAHLVERMKHEGVADLLRMQRIHR